MSATSIRVSLLLLSGGLVMLGCPGRIVGAGSTDGGEPDGSLPDASTSTDGGADAGSITFHPTNLLNNGGFELGTMCYGQYEWGVNPANPGTGYQFSLSTDAHSGNYALQIQCVNPSDCGFPAKAAVQAYSFHTPHSQAYQVSVYTKCTSGDEAFFYTPNGAPGTNIPAFTCNGSWALNQFSFTTTTTDDYVYYALYYAGANTLLIDDLVVTYEDGTVPAQTIRHSGSRAVSVTGGVFTVDGQPFIPLGFYGIPAEQLSAARQMGVNAVAWGDPGGYNTDAPVYADTAYEAGIALIPESSSTARVGASAVFPAVMQQFGTHLADIAWYVDDEPDLAAWTWQPIAPTLLSAEYQEIHTASSLPVAAMLQRSHYDVPASDQPYAPAMDIYMSEPYGTSFDGVTHTMEVFGTMTPRPVWFAMDDAPNPIALVAKAYFAFTSGGTGLFFFTWDGFTSDSKLAAAGQAITELSSLTAALTGTDLTAQVTGPPGISLIPVQFEGRSITATAGAFGDTFRGISRHVYVLQ